MDRQQLRLYVFNWTETKLECGRNGVEIGRGANIINSLGDYDLFVVFLPKSKQIRDGDQWRALLERTKKFFTDANKSVPKLAVWAPNADSAVLGRWALANLLTKYSNVTELKEIDFSDKSINRDPSPIKKSKMQLDSEESSSEEGESKNVNNGKNAVKREDGEASKSSSSGSSGSESESEEKKPVKKTPVKKSPGKANARTTPAKKLPARRVKKEEQSSEEESSSSSAESEKSESDYEEGKKTPAKRGTPAKRTPVKKAPPKKTPTKKVKKESGSESGSESEPEEEEKKTPVKKTPAKKTPVKANAKNSPKTPAAGRKRKIEGDEDEKPPAKKPRRGEKKEEEEKGPGWWEEDTQSWKKGAKKNWKWQTLRHNGVLLAPPYVPHGVKMLYDGEPVELTPEQEEWATYFSRYLDSDHMKKKQFSTNFFADWKKVLGKKHVIKDFKKCDFKPIHNHLVAEKEKRASRTKEEKLAEKAEKDKMKEKYGWAYVDGRKEQIGNYAVEPPGLFLGRGNHPKAGSFKGRVSASDITINVDKNAPVPKCPGKGKWGGVVHNNEVMWLASWKAPVLGTPKYVQFAANTSLRGRSDRNKFATAQQLKALIKDIRESYTKDLTSEDATIRQRATAMWVIDKLALRVGNEKGKDEADTVGCCTLRIEHITLHKPDRLQFDFLGKDSMPYKNTVTVDEQIYKNFKIMVKGKSKSDEIFHLLTPTKLNAHLGSFMKGLSAKVFRTFNASHTMQEELKKYDVKKNKGWTADQKLLFFNQASVQVAILCNHQRTVSKTHADQMGKIDEQIAETKDFIKLVKKHEKALESGSKKKLETDKKLPTTVEGCTKKIKMLEDRIARLETKKLDKDQLKEVSTSTSKVNYIDPRVTLAWCKKVGLDYSKVFSKTLRNKFEWAIAEVEADEEFVF